jgi:hypothetical protein
MTITKRLTIMVAAPFLILIGILVIARVPVAYFEDQPA